MEDGAICLAAQGLEHTYIYIYAHNMYTGRSAAQGVSEVRASKRYIQDKAHVRHSLIPLKRSSLLGHVPRTTQIPAPESDS